MFGISFDSRHALARPRCTDVRGKNGMYKTLTNRQKGGVYIQGHAYTVYMLAGLEDDGWGLPFQVIPSAHQTSL